MGRVFGDGHGGHQLIITAKTDDVLEALKTNREAHIDAYKKAKLDYFVAAKTLLEKELGSIKEGKYKDVHVTLSRPTNHEKVYDTAIRMMELHKQSGTEAIQLDSRQVDSLVHDLWDWTDHFNSTIGSYANV